MQLHEIERALDLIGPFHMVLLDSDAEYSWGPLLDDGPVAACSFQKGTYDGRPLSVRVCTYRRGDTPPAMSGRANKWVSVYIDGRFVRDAELFVTGTDWGALVTDTLGRRVSVLGDGDIPAEIRLATTRGRHFPSNSERNGLD